MRRKKTAALATVIRVSGSSYRRPGARMLVAGDGRTWGGVSGGCLERDVARRARQVIDSGIADLRQYDTTDDFDSGAALGCAGVIEIFIERISTELPGPIPALRTSQVDRQLVAQATVITSVDKSLFPGTRYFSGSSSTFAMELLTEVLENGMTGMRTCDRVELFVELHRSPQALVFFGGGK